jgi:S1-C subfamily serine protease
MAAMVGQCGSNSLIGDRLECSNGSCAFNGAGPSRGFLLCQGLIKNGVVRTLELQSESHQPPAPVHSGISNAAVRIAIEHASGTGWGSGTIVRVVDGTGLVITAGHLFRSSETKQMRQWRHIRANRMNGQKLEATFLGVDPVIDVAAISIPLPDEPDFGVHIAKRDGHGSAMMVGFANTGRLHAHHGRIRELNGRVGRPGDADDLYNFGIDQGDSGGGVFDERGRLVGVGIGFVPASYMPDQPAVVVSAENVKKFIESMPTCRLFARSFQ